MAEVWTWVSRSGQSISDAWEGLKLGSTSAGAALFTVFVKGAGFSSMRVHQRATGGPDWNRTAGKMNGGIRKPAPLNTARVRHPIFTTSLKLVQQFRCAKLGHRREK